MAATRNSKTTTRNVVLHLAFELGETEWKLALTIGVGQKPQLRFFRIKAEISSRWCGDRHGRLRFADLSTPD
jgi:hypothetical protein